MRVKKAHMDHFVKAVSKVEKNKSVPADMKSPEHIVFIPYSGTLSLCRVTTERTLFVQNAHGTLESCTSGLQYQHEEKAELCNSCFLNKYFIKCL